MLLLTQANLVYFNEVILDSVHVEFHDSSIYIWISSLRGKYSKSCTVSLDFV